MREFSNRFGASCFDTRKGEYREATPDGILIIRPGPPFEMLLCDIRRCQPFLDLSVDFNLRRFLHEDTHGLSRVLSSGFYKAACSLFDAEPVATVEELSAARLVHAIGCDWARYVARFPPALHAKILFYGDRSAKFRAMVEGNQGLAVDALRRTDTACGKRLLESTEYLESLLTGGTRAIASKLGWPTGTAGVPCRIWAPAASFQNIERLKTVLCEDSPLRGRRRKVLPHGEHITADAIQFVLDPMALNCVKNCFLVDLCSQVPDGFQPGTGDWEIFSSLLQAQRRFPRVRIPRLQSVAQLRRLGRRYFSLLRPDEITDLLKYEFPPAPIEPDESFRAIEDSLSALEEYTVMGPNCLPTLIPEVADGSLYFYQVLCDPKREIERATLVISRYRTNDGEWIWAPMDARTFRNQRVSAATVTAITAFLSRSQISQVARDVRRTAVTNLLAPRAGLANE